MKIVTKIVKRFRDFSLIIIGMMLSMFFEFGIKTEYVVCYVLALITYICTSVKIKEDEEMEE